ncbi:MAG: DNA polymerase III subunit delta [Lachnospiraceae bacterium]|nr:DNA polymerase III subunit delta [Lachnospiraceae bacterium]
MDELKKQIKECDLKKCYLFFGEDDFSKSRYEKGLKEAVLGNAEDEMNIDIFEGKKASALSVYNAVMTCPFLCEKRLVIVKNSGFFSDENKSEGEEAAGFIPDIPESTCLLFIEEKVDRRLKLYKTVSEHGFISEFKPLSEREIVSLAKERLNKNGFKVDTKTLALLAANQNGDLRGVWTELDKLIQYKKDESLITEEDIEAICSKTLESKIFDLIDAIGNKKTEKALIMYNDMLKLKENPIMMLSMMSRQFRLMIVGTGFLEEGKSIEEAASAMGQKAFPLEKAARQCRFFTLKKALWALNECLETDISIKSGFLSPERAVELLIISCCA